MSKKPFGGLFDFNHDGQESLFEQFTAYHLSDGAMPTDHLPKWLADAFRASIPKPYTPSHHDYSTNYSDPDWWDTCEDGSEYDLDPDDFDDEDEYNDALEEARNAWKDDCEDGSEYEDENAAPTISISLSFEFPGLKELEAIHEEDYPNKRRYNAAYTLANRYVAYAYEEDRIKNNDRCHFILEQGDRLVAANYLSYDYGFLYAQAVKNHFDLPCSLPDEDESRKIEFHEMLCRIAKRHIGLSFEVWKWCLAEFMPYAQYDDEAEENMTSDVLCHIYRFPKTYRARLLEQMVDDPDFLQTLVSGGSYVSDAEAELIVLAIQTKRYDTAVSILRAELPKGEKDPTQLRRLIRMPIVRCKIEEAPETMKSFRDHCLSLVAPSAAVAEDLEKWNAEIAEYIDE